MRTQVDRFERVFEHWGVTVAAWDYAAAGAADEFGGAVPDEHVTEFDDTDGAYAVAEPDPFVDAAGLRPLGHRHPSLRAELRAAPARPIASLSRSATPPLPVPGELSELLPHGLRRGSTLAVTSSVSLLLNLIGTASAKGAWVAMIGMPAMSAEAAAEAGVDLSRLAIISPPEAEWTSASWATAVGALLDAVDIVVARPGITGARSSGQSTGIADGDARRLTARARNKDAVLVLFGQQAASWPAVELQLSAQHAHWSGIGDGYGRLTARRLTVSATGKGRSAQPRTIDLWLPRGESPAVQGQSDPELPMPMPIELPIELPMPVAG
jgi:hypothetical protein